MHSVTVLGVTDLTARCVEFLSSIRDVRVERVVVPSGADETRGTLAASLVATAESLGISLTEPHDVPEHVSGWGFSVGFPEIFTPTFIGKFEQGLVNLHLPRFLSIVVRYGRSQQLSSGKMLPSA